MCDLRGVLYHKPGEPFGLHACVQELPSHPLGSHVNGAVDEMSAAC
jgi:hypothetical protein